MRSTILEVWSKNPIGKGNTWVDISAYVYGVGECYMIVTFDRSYVEAGAEMFIRSPEFGTRHIRVTEVHQHSLELHIYFKEIV